MNQLLIIILNSSTQNIVNIIAKLGDIGHVGGNHSDFECSREDGGTYSFSDL